MEQMKKIDEAIRSKIESGREYRAMSMEAREVEDNSYIVEGYATTFNQPYYLYSFESEADKELITVYEQVSDKAFDNTDMSDVIFQYDHTGRVFARLSNDTLKLDIEEKGLKVNAELGGTQIGKELYEEIKGGYTTKMSFGFTVLKDNLNRHENGRDYIRTIEKIGKLYDVSAVSYPQNDYTEISARKQLDGAIKELEVEYLNEQIEKREKAEKIESLQTRLRALRKEQK